MAFTELPRLNRCTPLPGAAERPLEQLCSLRKSAAPAPCAVRRPAYPACPLPWAPPPRRRAARAAGGGLQRSWGGELPDWELDPYCSDDEVEEDVDAAVFGGGDGDGGGGFEFQNGLAAVLIGALALAVGNVLFKLGVVAAALIGAAFRYTAVGFIVVVLIALFS